MKADSLIFRRLSQADFKNISGQGGVEGGGGQGYIDISTKGVTKEMMYSFLGAETSIGAKGPRWEFQVKSLSLGDEEQTIAIYQRRDASFCIASQKIGTRESNRVEIWKTERTGFPDESYDEVSNPLIVYIVKTTDNTYWAGWFYLNEGYHFKMNSATAAMFAKDDGYIKFEQDVEIDTKKYKWPFHFKFPLVIDVKDNNNNSDNMKSNHFLAALRTKPFMLLAGISGTGKSRIVRKLAQASVTEELQKRYDPKSVENGFDRWQLHKPANFEIVQVKPNWHNSLEVVGYKSNIGGAHYEFTPFVEFLVKAWKHQDVPFFLCLDEMNLAPVEQYFAEFLSAIESRSIENDEYVTDPIIKPFDEFGEEICAQMLNHLVGKVDAAKAIPGSLEAKLVEQFKTKGLTLPKNLFVLGTVNMDETTFSFSRKVLDRAMSIVMNDVEYNKFFTGETENDMAEFDDATKELLIDRPIRGLEAEDNGADLVEQYLTAINEVLNDTPFKLGYRAANEALLYVSAAHLFDSSIDVNAALDEFTLMKILSRIEGDKRSIGNLLKDLQSVINDSYPASNKRLVKMAETLQNKQFVSYWT
ncbi:MAG: hypothetical protein J6S89_11930 [Paludibacteraceae bacterium]|nr:hypothetical protein [Paludibacteraceae bacterium]